LRVENEETNASKNIPSSIINSPSAVPPVEVEKAEEIHKPTPTNEPKEIKTEPSHESNTDTDDLLSQVLAKLENGSFKDNLQDQIVIDEVIDNKVKIIAINKISEMMLKKPENITHIQKIISEVL
jgi:hypothetical protein